MELSPEQLQYQLARRHESRVVLVEATLGVCMGLALISTALRFYARHTRNMAWKYDDWLIALASVGHVTLRGTRTNMSEHLGLTFYCAS